MKGQALTETCLRSGNWRKRSKGYEEETNDDLILDCAAYFSRDDTKVWVWSGDVQLCAKSIMQSLFVLYDQESLDAQHLLRAVQNDQSISPRQAVQTRNENWVPMQGHDHIRNGDDMIMDVDESFGEREMQPFKIQHPLDELHEQVVSHFTELLRDIALRAVSAVAVDTQKASSGLLASRHAPRFGDAVHALPTPSEISMFTCSECVQFLAIIPPQSFLDKSERVNSAIKPEHYEFSRVANFLKPPYNPGARRGRDWTREDWRDALTLLDKAARYWQDPGLSESCSICRPVMENIFRGLDS